MKLHPEYGLNPTVAQCLYCGEEKNELALLGASYKGEAPHRMVIDTEPCDACAEQWKQGIAFLECNDERIPTGRMALVTEEGTRKIIKPGELLDQVLKMRRLHMDKETFEAIFCAKQPEGQ